MKQYNVVLMSTRWNVIAWIYLFNSVILSKLLNALPFNFFTVKILYLG